MLIDSNWKTLEDRRIISRLTVLCKSFHNILVISIDEHYANREKRIITTSETSSISFAHPTARTNCYMCTFMLVAEWNRLPATMRESPYVDTFKARLCSINLSTHFI